MREDSREWFHKGDEDLKAAKILYREGLYALSCFHSQQAIEKYLKAFLVEKGQEISKTHNLKFLINECREIDPAFAELLKRGVHYLTEYAVEVRYPGIYVPEKEDAEEALKLAEFSREFIAGKLRVQSL
ncbi:HEPN domain-containing protein [Thermococcus sp. MAR1]|uniref:HEPN domain-containing protein n=1 Tax=Thermococcus sp. MAR1 TaxID=1638263 RepID=UPI00143BDDC2|nr:HEPN domain-containing protein [Thermococcus sp. MAR1]NJE10424.1 HEPN domain-containing protein [Thermococcus sp. MAR1]